MAIPDPASAQVNVTVTLPVFHPALFGAGDVDATMVGIVLSMFSVTDVLAELPAASVAVRLTICPVPSAPRTTEDGHDATPDPLSAQLKLTVTSPLFQPDAFGGGET